MFYDIRRVVVIAEIILPSCKKEIVAPFISCLTFNWILEELLAKSSWMEMTFSGTVNKTNENGNLIDGDGFLSQFRVDIEMKFLKKVRLHWIKLWWEKRRIKIKVPPKQFSFKILNFVLHYFHNLWYLFKSFLLSIYWFRSKMLVFKYWSFSAILQKLFEIRVVELLFYAKLSWRN